MNFKRILWLGSVAAVLGVGGGWAISYFQDPYTRQLRGKQYKYDVPYVPTPQPVVDKMLEMAAVKKDDVVYDLGCGDGRIVITAVKKYGARGIGVDIDPARIKDSNANAEREGVTGQVTFVKQDLFKMDFKDATVVTLYLLPDINKKLRPKLLSELKPGTRIVSHDFDMGEWKPEKTVQVKSDREHVLYYWTIPEAKDRPVFTDEKPKPTSSGGPP